MNHDNPESPCAQAPHDWQQDLMSALADGQLAGEEFAAALQAATRHPQALQQWHSYHLIGDVMRSRDLATDGARQTRFVQRLQARLQATQVRRPALAEALAKTSDDAPVAIKTIVEGAVSTPENRFMADKARTQPAANDGSFRWKMAAGFASAAALAVMGWNLAGLAWSEGQARLAQTQTAPVSAHALMAAGAVAPPALPALPASAASADALRTAQDLMLRDPHLDELMAAHRQQAGASALQMPAGFLRNATFEAPGR